VAGDLGKKLDEVIKREGRGVFWGAVVVVSDGTVVLEKGYGQAGGERGKVRPDSWFDVGSVSKQFTAAAVLRLVDKGTLRLDQPISELLDAVPADKSGITVRQLLSHTSGLPIEIKPDGDSALDRDKMVARVMKAKLASKPGEKFAYNNVGYFVLAAIVERAAKKDFESVLAEEVFTPAEMSATHTVSEKPSKDERETLRHSPALRGRDTTASHYAWTWWFKGATGVVSSAEDLRKWDEALRGDKLLTATSRRLMFEVGATGEYAMGWFVDYPGTADARVYHGGSTPGYRSFIIRLLAKQTMVAVLTNEEHNAEGIARAIMQVIAPDPLESGVWTRAYLTRFKPDQVGRYHSTDPGRNGKDGAMWLVMPRYDGMDENGRAIRDERTTLVLQDPKAPGKWMMLSRIDDESTRQLIKELESAIALRRGAGLRGDNDGLEVRFETVPYGMKPNELVDYPTRARWRAMAGPAAGARFTPENARNGDERVTVFLEDPENKKTPIVAAMDIKTADKLLCDLKMMGPDGTGDPDPKPAVRD
jgi:CubicO group peptidase (beta-lactamase class C family)